MKELTPPPISAEQGAVEILRVWTLPDGPQQASLDTTWEDPAAWGIFIVDLAKHAANAYASATDYSFEEALQRIKCGIQAELDSPTDAPKEIDV